MAWTNAPMVEVYVAWLEIDQYAEIRSDAEVVRAKFYPRTENLPASGFFDAFGFYRSLFYDKVTGSYVMYFPIPPLVAGEPFEIPVFGAVFYAKYHDPEEEDIPSAIITNAHILPKNNISGDDTDYVQFQLVNKKNDQVMSTLTLIEGADLTAYKVTSMGPINEHGAVDLFEGVSFNVVSYGNGIDFTEPSVLIIEYNLN